MNPIVDSIMLVLFVLFMVFVLGGYHKTKSAQREKDVKKHQDEKEKNS